MSSKNHFNANAAKLTFYCSQFTLSHVYWRESYLNQDNGVGQ